MREYSVLRKRSACEVSPAYDASTWHVISSTLLVVGALGLYTLGLVCLDGVYRLSALFLLWRICRAALA